MVLYWLADAIVDASRWAILRTRPRRIRHLNTRLSAIQQNIFDHRPVVQEYLEGGCARLISGLEPNHLWRLAPNY